MSKKWFLFIEWSVMILVAGVWIVSAALFPSMTSYLNRSRDAARAAHLKDITTALGAYYADKEVYPEWKGGCVSTLLNTNYLPKWIPTDPVSGRLSWNCDGSDGMTYGYGLFSDTYYTWFYIVANLENALGGNAATLPPSDPAELKAYLSNLRKWAGPYFVLSN